MLFSVQIICISFGLRLVVAINKALGELKDLLLNNPRLPYKGGWKIDYL